MKVLFLTIFFALPVLAVADGEGQKLAEVPVVSEEAMHDLFGRVRDAHLRAVQRGGIAMNSATLEVLKR